MSVVKQLASKLARNDEQPKGKISIGLIALQIGRAKHVAFIRVKKEIVLILPLLL